MNNPTEIKLPTNALELKEFAKKAIEIYIKSPVTNDNKLNEVVAKSLGFKNNDAISPLLKAEKLKTLFNVDKPEEYTYSVSINDIIINEKIFEDELSQYELVNRKSRISDLNMYISEARNDPQGQKNKTLMNISLDFLLSIDDDFVFESIRNGNDMVAVSVNTKRFNEICNDILIINTEFNKS
jgi:hypothetical protein